MNRCLLVIPARLQSTRLPRKLLLDSSGKTLIQHTYESALQAQSVSKVVVAVDHESIKSTVEGFGGEAVMTDPGHQSGTDRIAEAIASYPEYDLVVNVQGDEPEISGSAIDLAIEILKKNNELPMSTLAAAIRDRDLLENPSCVKVVFDQQGQALYFSRSPIPFQREDSENWLDHENGCFFQHIGLYAYRRSFLLEFPKLSKAPLEEIEKLEQLRVLYAGFQIGVGVIDHPTKGIDTQEDYDAFVRRQLSC